MGKISENDVNIEVSIANSNSDVADSMCAMQLEIDRLKDSNAFLQGELTNR